MKISTTLGLLSAAALFVTPAFAPLQARDAVRKDSPQAAQKPVHARPAMWVVRDDDTVIYLLGTIHLMKPQVQWFEGNVRATYEAAEQVVLEVTEENEESAAIMMRKALNPDGTLTSEMLTEETRAKLAGTAQTLGLPMAFLDRMKPWFVAITLSMAPYQSLGFDANQGVDAILKKKAKADGKTLTGLETAAEQIDFLDSIPHDQQMEMLGKTLDEMDEARSVLETMLSSWVRGDPEALGALMNKSMSESPDIAKALLFDRNERWAEWIKARMAQPGTVLLAVGAGHLAGKESLQEKLEGLGIKVHKMKAISARRR
jgi:hypothetical protein